MVDFNPYTAPSVESDAPARPRGSGEPLFTDTQVAGATFLGSPLAGFLVMAINERRLGRPEGFTKMIVFGIVATVIVLGVSLILPPEVPGLIVTVAYVFGMRQLAAQMQGTEITERLSLGTPKGSGWVVFGVAMGCFAVMLGLIVGLVVHDPSLAGLE